MVDFKDRFKYVIETVTLFMTILGYAIGMCTGIMAWNMFRTTSTCSNSAIISLQNWLFGYAVAVSVFGAYVTICLILKYAFKVQFKFLFNLISVNIFLAFFFCYHWFVYDAIYSKSMTCRIDAASLWMTTFTIVILQLFCIPFYIISMLILRELDKFHQTLPDKSVTITQTGQAIVEGKPDEEGNFVIDL